MNYGQMTVNLLFSGLCGRTPITFTIYYKVRSARDAKVEPKHVFILTSNNEMNKKRN